MGEKTPRRVWLHDDQPCPGCDQLEDLGAEATAAAVADIARTASGPFTIGVFGDWGSGKTSVLERAAVLCEGPGTVVLRLNPWEHEREADPLASLLVELGQALEEKKQLPEFNWLEKAYVVLKPRLDRALASVRAKELLGLASLPLLAQGNPVGDALAAASALAPASPEPGTEAAARHRSVREKLEAALGDNKVVVLLDDLDRCQPDRALAVLEAVKHLLWARGFVFVVALDQRLLTGYLEKLHTGKFGVAEPGSGTRYLEKLVQTRVPVAHRDRDAFREYVEKIVTQAIEENKAWLPDEAETGGVPGLLAAAAASQPRQAKRLVNNVVVSWALAGDDLTAESAAGIALSRVLYELLPETSEEGGLPSFEDFVATPEWAERHRALAESLDRPQEDEEGGRPGDGDRASADPQGVWIGLRLREAIEDASFRPWLRDANLRLRWCRFASSGTESAQIEASAVQAEIVLGLVRKALDLEEGDDVPPGAEVREVSASFSGLTDDGLAFLASQPWAAGLQVLRLWETRVTDAGLEHLRGLAGLQTLDLSGTQVTDAGLEHLKGLAGLQTLFLADTQVTDAGLEHLRGLAGLQELYLTNTQVTDAGLAHLRKLTGLQELYLMNIQVTDAGLEHLKGLAGLRELFLGGSQVTDAGVEAFHAWREEHGLPECTVIR
ncbi:MAG: P-loop NTPase fold protein [Fimbriimonadaceae bacterium]